MFKHEKDQTRFMFLHPLALSMMFDMKAYCDEKKIPFIVTSTMTTKEEDDAVRRISSSHRTGRAFDISLREWGMVEIAEFLRHFNGKYKQIAAYSSRSGKPALLVRHNSGFGDHIHAQINAKFRMPAYEIHMECPL